MADKQQYQTPSGMAGLVRYYDEEDAAIKMSPKTVMGICVGLIIMEIMLFMLAPGLLV